MYKNLKLNPELIFVVVAENKSIRQNENQSSLLNVPPNNLESVLIHEMFKKTIDMK